MNFKKRTVSIILILTMILTALALGFTLVGNAAAETGKPEIDVWLIGGQSNAVGYGSDSLPADYLGGDPRYEEGFDNVLFYGDYQTSACACNEGCPDGFVPVTVGLGKHTDSSCVTVGAEIGMAKALSNGDRQNAIIKFAWGGTFIYPTTDGTPARDWGTWTPPSYLEKYDISTEGTLTGALYTGFVNTVAEGVAKLRTEGYTPVLRGMWWMQGEAESPYEARANAYEELLECLIRDVRADMTDIFGTDQSNMPFVLGNIYRNQTKNGESFRYEQVGFLHTINEAQYAVASKLSGITVISNGDDAEWGYEVDGYTDQPFFKQLDGWHFSAQVQHHFGEQFINAVIASEGKHSVTLGGANATMTGGGAYSAGDTVTVTVAPTEGCNITSVTANGGAVALSDLGGGKYSFTMPDGNVVISVVSVDPNAIVTEYGTIPSKFTDAQKYPFLLFKNGEIVAAFENWGSFVNANGISGATMLMRRDYTFLQTESNWGICYTQELTLDLGGNTLSSEKGTFFMLMTRDAAVHTTKVTVKNGDIKLADTYVKTGETQERSAFAFIIFTSYNNAATTTRDNFELIFDGINIDINSGRALVSTYADGDVGSNGKVVFNDCTFDYTAPKRATTTLFNLVEGTHSGDTVAQNKHDISVEINGGVLKSSGTKKVTFAAYSAVREGECDIPDSLTFGTGSGGNKFTLELPDGKTLANCIDAGVYPINSDTAGTTDKYTDFVNLTTPYGVISTTYADPSEYPLIAFKDGTCHLATKDWHSFLNSTLKNYTGADLLSGGVIYLRRDYTTAEPGTNSNWGLAYLKDVTVDLGGHTFTRNGGKHMFQALGRDAGALSAKITVKNGKLVASDNPLICVNSQNDGTKLADSFEFIFDGITIDVSSGKSIITCFDGGVAGCSVKLTLNNCTIDRGSSESGAKLFEMAGSDTQNRYDMQVYINGGKLISKNANGLNFASFSPARDGVVPDKFYVDSNFTVRILSGTFTTKFSFTEGEYMPVKTGEADGRSIYKLMRTESTPYGDVPAEYIDSNLYPFLIVKDGKIVVDSSFTTTQWNTLINTILASDKYKSGYTVYLRRDYSTTEAGDTWMLCHIDEVTFDLGGHTLTRGNYQIFQAMGRDSTDHATKITLKNGTIVTTEGKTPIICFTNTSSNNTSSDKFDFIFDKITFDVSSGVGIAVGYRDGNGGTVDSITLNDCVISRGNRTSGPVLFNLADERNANDVDVIINGGKLTMDSLAGFGIMVMLNDERTEGEGAPDSFTLGRYEGEYMTLELPAGASAPTLDYHGYKFVKKSSDGTTAVYTPVPTASVGLDFKPMASVTLDSNLIFNIYIPAHAGLGTVTLDGATVTLGEAKGGYYLVSVELPADEAARELKLAVNLTVDGTALKGSFTFSTVKYAEKLLAMDITDKEELLIKDMLAYINSAYELFNGESVAKIDTILNGYISKAVETTDAKQNVPGLSGATFVLTAKPAVRFYFAEGYTYDDFTFMVGGRNLTEKDIANDDVTDFVEFSLYAYEMTETFSYTVDGDSGEYNLIAYYAYVSGEGDNFYQGADKEKLADLTAKFYNYCRSAAEYKTAVTAE